MTTPDGAQLNLDALYKICPSCFTETAAEDGSIKRVVDFNKLRALLGDNAEDNAPEAYDFTWVGKRAAQREAAAPIKKTLRPCPEESVDWENTQNLYIEGDNLEVLKLLQNSYMGKVKMIYIDPPYNTGNDFVYHDDFAQSADEYDEHNINEDGERFRRNTDSNGRFHSDWCSMMYSRLMVAKTFLSDDGAIFISIDENEIDSLKKICAEVFGETNFRNSFIARRYDKNLNRQFIDSGLKSFNTGFEYILCYAKSSDFNFNPIFKEASEERQSSGYWKGFWNDADRPTMRYNILGFTPTSGQWKWSQAVAEEAVNNYIEYVDLYSKDMSLEEYWKKTGKSKRFIRKNPNGKGKNQGVENWIAPADGILRNTNWLDILASKNDFATQGLFDFPKNVDLIKIIIDAATDDNSLILDFFSGSSTTAHAIMMKNSESELSNRRYIMVQLPEQTPSNSEANTNGYKTIPDIAKERIKRAGQKIKEDTKKITKNIDTGFRVFKCDESNMKDVYFAPNDYSQGFLSMLEDNIKEDRTDLDLLFDCMLRWGVELSLPLSSKKVGACTIHNVNDGDLVACFDGTITDQVIDAIAEMSPLRVVFRDSSFEEASQKMNLFELFKQKCGWSDYEVRNNVKVI